MNDDHASNDSEGEPDVFGIVFFKRKARGGIFKRNARCRAFAIVAGITISGVALAASKLIT